MDGWLVWEGKLAGLPEGDEVFEVGEEAGEGGQDEGVQGGGQPAWGWVAWVVVRRLAIPSRSEGDLFNIHLHYI